jgi:hypothetical protein
VVKHLSFVVDREFPGLTEGVDESEDVGLAGGDFTGLVESLGWVECRMGARVCDPQQLRQSGGVRIE